MEKDNICNTIREQALRVAKEVDMAGYTGLGIHEETLSDLLLNQIEFNHTDNFLTRKFTKKEEGSITGADWLWCVGEPGSWITFAVQAKIVNPYTERVNYLHYRNGEQYHLLINFCREFKFIPKYSVYSKINIGSDFVAREIVKNIPLEQWAFSMVSPRYIKALKTTKEKHVSSVLKFSLPWSYVFCGKTKDSGFTLAEKIAKNLENAYWIFEKEFKPKQSKKTRNRNSRINWENPWPSRLITKDIPLPVMYLLTSKTFPHKVPIPNVSIFSISPVQHVLEIELKKIEGQKKWKRYPNIFEQAIWRIQDSIGMYLLPE